MVKNKRSDIPLMVLSKQELLDIAAHAARLVLAEAADPERVVSRQQLADALGVSISSIAKLLREGAPHVKVGDTPRFILSQVMTWLETREGGGDA